MTTTANADFAKGVSAALSAVFHLYAQIDRLNESIVTALRDGPDPFQFVGGTPLAPGKTGKAERQIRGAYRLLLAPGEDVLDDDDNDDQEDEGEDEGFAQGTSGNADRFTRPKGPAQLESDGVYLALGVVVHDVGLADLGPHLHWAIIGGLGIGPSGQRPTDGRLVIAKHMVTRVLRAIDPSKPFDPTKKIATKAKARGGGKRMGESMVSFRFLAQLGMVPLEQLDSEQAVAKLIRRIKDDFARVVANQGSA